MMEGWKETELGFIPNDWEQSVLSKYAEKPQYGFTDSSSNSGNAKFLRITDITDTGVNWNDVPYCNCPDIEKYKLVNGDIVFARFGAHFYGNCRRKTSRQSLWEVASAFAAIKKERCYR